MAKMTRTELSKLDTDGDGDEDVIFSVTPEQPQKFKHPGAVTYLVQVENLRTNVTLRLLKKRADVAGNEEYEFLDKSVGVGERVTIESVMLAHSTPAHPKVNPERLAQTLKYRVAIGDARFPTSFDVLANCFDGELEQQGASVDPPSQGDFVLRGDARAEFLACAKRLVELLG